MPLQQWHAIQNHKLGMQFGVSLLKSNAGTMTRLSYGSKNTRCRRCVIPRPLFFASEYDGMLSKITHCGSIMLLLCGSVSKKQCWCPAVSCMADTTKNKEDSDVVVSCRAFFASATVACYPKSKAGDALR